MNSTLCTEAMDVSRVANTSLRDSHDGRPAGCPSYRARRHNDAIEGPERAAASPIPDSVFHCAGSASDPSQESGPHCRGGGGDTHRGSATGVVRGTAVGMDKRELQGVRATGLCALLPYAGASKQARRVLAQTQDFGRVYGTQRTEDHLSISPVGGGGIDRKNQSRGQRFGGHMAPHSILTPASPCSGSPASPCSGPLHPRASRSSYQEVATEEANESLSLAASRFTKERLSYYCVAYIDAPCACARIVSRQSGRKGKGRCRRLSSLNWPG